MKTNKPIFFLIILISFFAVLFSACKKEEISDPETGTITDIDGNVYKTVKIGAKWWMAENLKVQRYRNGDSISFIPQSNPESVWSSLKTGAYCYSDKKFGFLYNFQAVSDSRNIAPTGWHIPSDDEWKEMEIFLGMSVQASDSLNWRGTDQGNKLKIAGGSTTDWAKSSDVFKIFGTNDSGFTATGGACRIFNGQWGETTHTSFWWTSSLNGAEAWYRGLDYNKANVLRFPGPKNYGFSIRCVKD